MDTILDKYERVLERIALSAQSVGRKPETIRLVVVTKLQPVEVLEEAIHAGARFLGENYADEALQKKITLKERCRNYQLTQNGTTMGSSLPFLYRDVQWHIIGHVQSRKARIVVESFDYLHSLDSLALSQRLDYLCSEKKRILPVLLEVNLSGESSKSGWNAWEEKEWAQLLPEIEQIKKYQHLLINGLMTMPPYFENPEKSRPYFKKIRLLQDYLYKYVPDVSWCELSMGMSGDFEVAIQEGATWIRIGQAILGSRRT